jgi:hypothetical protein
MIVERQSLLPVVESSPCEPAQLEFQGVEPRGDAPAGAAARGPYLVSIFRNCPEDSNGLREPCSVASFLLRHFPH